MSRRSHERRRKAEDNARKLRDAAETHPGDTTERDDRHAVDAHNELTQPDHSKGRPRPDRDPRGGKRPSNAGNDGP